MPADCTRFELSMADPSATAGSALGSTVGHVPRALGAPRSGPLCNGSTPCSVPPGCQRAAAVTSGLPGTSDTWKVTRGQQAAPMVGSWALTALGARGPGAAEERGAGGSFQRGMAAPRSGALLLTTRTRVGPRGTSLELYRRLHSPFLLSPFSPKSPLPTATPYPPQSPLYVAPGKVPSAQNTNSASPSNRTLPHPSSEPTLEAL